MKNYDFAALSSGFQNNLELQNIYNNGNSKGRIQQNNRQRMMSSTDIIKNKSKNIQFNPISNRNFNPSQTQYDFNKRRERNSKLVNNAINYHLPRGGSQYNINALKKMNNQLEQENLNLMKDNRSIKLPEKNNGSINNYYNSRSGIPSSKYSINNNNNFKANIRPFNNNTNNINTSPNDNMQMYNNISNNNNDNYEGEEEENNDDDIDNIANEIDGYNNYDNNPQYNIMQNEKILKMRLNQLYQEKTLMEKKANEIIKANKEIATENELLKQKVNKLTNYINSVLNSKNDNNNINNKNQIIQKYMDENTGLKVKLNKLINQHKILQQNSKNKELIINDLNKKLLSFNEELNKNQEKVDKANQTEENFIIKYEQEIKALKNIIETNKKNNEDSYNSINIYLDQIKSLKEELSKKNKEIKEKEKNAQSHQKSIEELNNKIMQYEINNKSLEKINSELKIQLNNKEENDLNDSDTRIKMNELEEKSEALKAQNDELISKLEEKNKEIKEYKNKETEENKIKEEYEELKQKYEEVNRDKDNFKRINDMLLEESNQNKKMISDLEQEKEALNKSFELLKKKNSKVENEQKNFRKTEKNPFKIGDLELDPIKKEEARYSLGAKEARAEKYKKMLLDYENQKTNDLNQMNMLKADIKGLKSKLKEKEKKLGEIKVLIETGYKDISGKNKTQKDAIKRLKEIINENE